MSAKAAPKPDKSGKDVIYVDVDDEITGIIDKVENSPEKVVALVLPKRASSLQSTVNMKLLARSAKAAGKNPVLITSEGALLPLAGAAGLHVAKNLQSQPEIPDTPAPLPPEAEDGVANDTSQTDAEAVDPDNSDDDDLPDKIDYKNAAAIGALAAAHDAEHPETIDLDDDADTPEKKAPKKADKTPKGSKVKVPDFDRFRMLLGLGVLALIGLIIFLILAIKVLPKATITILTTSEPVSASFNLNASTSTTTLDTKTGAIPAKLETIDQTGTAQATATGQQNNGDKAAGSVTMSAQACAPNLGTPDDVPAGTGISSSGLNFITQSKTSFAFGSASGSCVNYNATSSTPIKAAAGGSKYNLGSGSSFSVRSGITATGSTTGGTDNNITVLTQNDVETAKQKITSSADPNFVKNWEKKLTDAGAYVITATLKTADPVVTSNPAVGQPASTATVTSKITHTVLTVKKTDLTQAFNAQLANQIDPKKQKLSASSLDDATITVASQTSANSATLTVNVDTTAVPIIDVNNVKKIAKGKKTGEITAIINNWPGVKAVDVKLSPFWVSKVPNKESKIKVVIKEVKSSSKNSGKP